MVVRAQASGSATIPWVRVRCAQGQNLSEDASEAGFPYLKYTETFADSNNRRFSPGFTVFDRRTYRMTNISGLDRSPSSRVRAQWTSLPIERFGDAGSGTQTTGLFVELPWTGKSRVGFGCAITGAWHNSTITSDRTANYDAWSAVITGMEYTWHYPGLVENADSLQTNKFITLEDTWLELLTPTIPSASNQSSAMTTLEYILGKSGIADVISGLRNNPTLHWDHSTNRCVYGLRDSDETDTQIWNSNDCGGGGEPAGKYVQLIVGSVVVDGLSRFGSHRASNIDNSGELQWSQQLPQTFNTSLLFRNLPQSSSRFASQWLSVSVVGWAYYASQVSDYLALAVVCAYMALAGAHVFWLLYWKHWISSGAWDSVTELLVLCKNSPPTVPSRLNNASAGIHRLGTFGTIVKVRVSSNITEEDEANDSSGLSEADGQGDAKVVLVEEPPPSSKDGSYSETKLALLKTMSTATVVASRAHPNLRQRADGYGKVKINARYG